MCSRICRAYEDNRRRTLLKTSSLLYRYLPITGRNIYTHTPAHTHTHTCSHKRTLGPCVTSSCRTIPGLSQSLCSFPSGLATHRPWFTCMLVPSPPPLPSVICLVWRRGQRSLRSSWRWTRTKIALHPWLPITHAPDLQGTPLLPHPHSNPNVHSTRMLVLQDFHHVGCKENSFSQIHGDLRNKKHSSKNDPSGCASTARTARRQRRVSPQCSPCISRKEAAHIRAATEEAVQRADSELCTRLSSHAQMYISLTLSFTVHEWMNEH